MVIVVEVDVPVSMLISIFSPSLELGTVTAGEL